MSAQQEQEYNSQAVLARCAEYGFARAGICRAQPSAHAQHVHDWLARNSHGQMGYLADDVPERLDPGVLVPGARSVICVADRYATGARDRRVSGRGRIARYARGEDYHQIIRVRLEALATQLRAQHPQHQFRVCVDTAPILEREHAARAGIGRVGKHTLLIGTTGQGSWLALGAVVTTLELQPTAAAADVAADPCGTCVRCIEACPTSAITPWSVDASRCISYLTIEHRGTIDESLGAQVQDWIFGCDICQEVCPHNQPTRSSRHEGAHAAYHAHVESLDLLQVLGWTQAHWEQARLHGALRRANRDMWVRNAALAVGAALAGDGVDRAQPAQAAELMQALQRVANREDEEPAVRTAAAQAMARASARLK